MRKLIFALVAFVLAMPALAQNNVRVIGRASDGIDRPVLSTLDGRMQVDSSASPTAASTNGIVPLSTSVAASSLIAKASAGNLYNVTVVTAGTAGYMMVFNSSTAPADGTVTPSKCLPVAANTGIESNMRSMPEYFSTGITIVFSSTGCFTKTASATAFISADVK